MEQTNYFINWFVEFFVTGSHTALGCSLSSCLCLPSAKIIGVYHNTKLGVSFTFYFFFTIICLCSGEDWSKSLPGCFTTRVVAQLLAFIILRQGLTMLPQWIWTHSKTQVGLSLELVAFLQQLQTSSPETVIPICTTKPSTFFSILRYWIWLCSRYSYLPLDQSLVAERVNY